MSVYTTVRVKKIVARVHLQVGNTVGYIDEHSYVLA